MKGKHRVWVQKYAFLTLFMEIQIMITHLLCMQSKYGLHLHMGQFKHNILCDTPYYEIVDSFLV